MSTGRLAGQVAWISGATSGIGEAAALLFAEEGARVALAGRRVDLSQAIVERIKASGGQAIAIACDVSREEDIRASIDQTVAVFGGLHIVVNNAGMVQVKMLHDCTEADWELVMGVNVKSMFLATKHALPHLAQPAKLHRQCRFHQQFRGPGQDPDLHHIQACRSRTNAFHRPRLRRRRRALQLRLSRNHRHSDAARTSECDTGP